MTAGEIGEALEPREAARVMREILERLEALERRNAERDDLDRRFAEAVREQDDAIRSGGLA